MAVTVYKSTDASAPVLSGTIGALTTLLDAILVNGYGAKAAAGWTIAFTAASRRVYRMTTVAATGFYLDINDLANVNTTSLGREALARGYEVATALSAGTGPFPSVAQIANGVCIRKSATNDATARPWVAVADNKTLYLFILSGDATGYVSFAFGDIYALKTGDAYRALIVGRSVNNSVVCLDSDDNLQNLAALSAAAAGHYMPRTWNGTDAISPVNVGKHGAGQHSGSVLAGLAHYPNPYDASLMLANVWVHEDLGSTASLRGRLRGFWHFLHPVSSAVNDGDTFSGTGALAGKTFLVVKPTTLGTGLYVLETSDTWEAST